MTQVTAGAALSVRDYLFSLEFHGIKLGLSNIQQLLARAGQPETLYPTLHIGGTNGKGSVVALLHAMFQAAGYRVGRFTSPHLLDVRERFQIDGACIPEAALEENTNFFRAVAENFGAPPTFFELNTAIAFRWFAQERVDLALIEVGLGGRLDSTNVLLPHACAITNIDLEHTEFLGDTLEEIASEKAGIIKPGAPVIIGEQQPAPRAVIIEAAREQGAPYRLLGEHFHGEVTGGPWRQRFSYRSDTVHLNDVPLGLAGRYQAQNAAVAVALAELCAERFERLDQQAIVAGLAQARWPGRMERVLDDPPVIMDVAHNLAGARQLAATVSSCAAIVAVSSDKNAAGMIDALAPIASPLVLTQFHSKRSLSVEALAQAAGPHRHVIAATLEEALDLALPHVRPEHPLLITGSIYLAGEARQLLMTRFGASPPTF